GHTEKVGSYKDNVRRAVIWLITQQDKQGPIGADRELEGQHLLAALALSEAAGMARVADTRAAAQKAVNYLTPERIESIAQLYSQNMNSVSLVWCVMALKSAKVAGLSVDHAAFEAALHRLDALEKKTGNVSRFANKVGDAAADEHATAAGLLCRMFL